MGKKMVGAVAMIGCGALTLGVGQSDVTFAKTNTPDAGESSLSIMDFRGALSMPKEQRPFQASDSIGTIDEQSQKAAQSENEVDAILKGLLGSQAVEASSDEESKGKESASSKTEETKKESVSDEKEGEKAAEKTEKVDPSEEVAETTSSVETGKVDVYGYKTIGLANVHTYLNVRDGASLSASIIGKMLPDSACEIEGYEGEWAKIHSGDVHGYVMGTYLLTGEQAKNRADYLMNQSVTVQATALRLRKDANTGSDVLRLVESGTRLSLTGTEDGQSISFADLKVIKSADGGDSTAGALTTSDADGWIHVSLNDQIQGYVRTEYVSLADGLRTAESTVVSPMDASPPISEETLAESLPPDEGVAEDIADLAEAVDSAEEETDLSEAADIVEENTGLEEAKNVSGEEVNPEEEPKASNSGDLQENSSDEADLREVDSSTNESQKSNDSIEDLGDPVENTSENRSESEKKQSDSKNTEKKKSDSEKKDQKAGSDMKKSEKPKTEVKKSGSEKDSKKGQKAESDSEKTQKTKSEDAKKSEESKSDAKKFEKTKSEDTKKSEKSKSDEKKSEKEDGQSLHGVSGGSIEVESEPETPDVSKKEKTKKKKEDISAQNTKNPEEIDPGSQSHRAENHYVYTESEKILLAGIIQAEAENQPYEGKMAVGSVVMNRVDNDQFPDTISGVIYAPNQFTPAGTGQLASILAHGPTSECIEVATEILNEDARNVPNLYFKSAYYAKVHGIQGFQIGDQVFH